MSTIRANTEEADASRRKIFVAVALLTALLVAGLVYLATRRSDGGGPAAQPRLEGALRADSPEFALLKDRIVIEYIVDDDTLDSVSAVGGRTITPMPTVRNFTGRTISGLELRAVALDIAGQPVKERTVIAVPARQPELEPNRTISPSLLLEGIGQNNMPASLRVEIVAVRFK